MILSLWKRELQINERTLMSGTIASIDLKGLIEISKVNVGLYEFGFWRYFG